jgi:hypothetical protein
MRTIPTESVGALTLSADSQEVRGHRITRVTCPANLR